MFSNFITDHDFKATFRRVIKKLHEYNFLHLPNVLVGLQLVGTKLLGETAAEHNNLTVSGDTWSFSLVLRRSFDGFLLCTRQNLHTSRKTFQTLNKTIECI